ncbi:integrase [Streptomyces microflavus]|uniref:integrase n=1 Tax=Streptomyces microflavus TaxID=1919 RepID=UPI0033FC738C
MIGSDIERVPAAGLHIPATADGTTPAEFTPEVLARLQELEQRSAQHERASRPTNTTESYCADWKHWESFCALLELPPQAITAGSLTAFVEWLWIQPGWKPGTFTAPSTIDRRLSGVVVTGRDLCGLHLPKTVAARARRVLKAKVKQMETTGEQRGRGPAKALLVEHLRQVVAAVPDNLRGIRDRSMILTHFAIAGREHEIALLRVRDFAEHENGLLLDVRVSKVKPRKVKIKYGTRPSTCPVRAWRAWKEAAGLTDPNGFAYRPLHPRWNTVMDGGLDPESIGDVVTRLGEQAGLDFRATGHSPRRGAATSSKRAKNDRKEIAAIGGWADNSVAMESYFEADEGWEEHAMNNVL